MKFRLLIFLIFSLMIQILAQENKPIGQEYFPLINNAEMVFESNIGETIKTVEYVDSLIKITNVSSKFTYTQTLEKKGNGIFLIRTEQNIDILFYSKSIDITYSSPILQFPQPFKIGESWKWTGFQIKNGDTTNVSVSGKAIGEEKITTPAGVFNTVKIKILFDEVDGEKTTLYQWRTPGFGTVKTKAIIDGSGVLQFAMNLLGYDEIDSELKEIRYLKPKQK